MVQGFVQYSVDEIFGEMPDDDPVRLRGYLKQLKDLILQETDIPVSCGAGESYTLAKTATWFAKHYPGYRGICVIPAVKREQALSVLPIREVWGIGRRRIKTVEQAGIKTALDFVKQQERWVSRIFGVTGVRTWKELNGIPAITIAGHDRQKSIMYSRTFARMITSKAALIRELSNFATAATRRLREKQLLCRTVTLFLATNRHRPDLPQYYNDDTIRLSSPTDDSLQVTETVMQLLDRLYLENYHYKQAGIILGQLQSSDGIQLDIFAPDQAEEVSKQKRLMQAIDGINRRFGKNQIHFAIQGEEADQGDHPAGFMRPHSVD